MINLSTTALAFATFLFASVLQANDRVDGKTFLDNPFEIVVAGAPMWHFGRPRGSKPCYPSSATDADGTPADGNAPDVGTYGNLNKGCGDPGPWNGRNSPGKQFPTYYTQTYCDKDGPSWRMTYFLYFAHDSSHKHDWEWVTTVWKKDPGDGDKWYRDTLIMSFHDTTHKKAWAEIQNTVNGLEDQMDQGKSDRNHAKIYVGAFKHAMFDDRYTGDDALTAQTMEFRSNDWYYLPLWNEDLSDGSKLPDADWGEAKSNPRALDICTK